MIIFSLSAFFPPSYATRDLVRFTTILNIIRQLIGQERLLPLKHQKIQTRSLSMATFLSRFNILNLITDLSGHRPQGFAHHHPKNPTSLLKGQTGEPSMGISATQISLQFLPFLSMKKSWQTLSEHNWIFFTVFNLVLENSCSQRVSFQELVQIIKERAHLLLSSLQKTFFPICGLPLLPLLSSIITICNLLYVPN